MSGFTLFIKITKLKYKFSFLRQHFVYLHQQMAFIAFYWLFPRHAAERIRIPTVRYKIGGLALETRFWEETHLLWNILCITIYMKQTENTKECYTSVSVISVLSFVLSVSFCSFISLENAYILKQKKLMMLYKKII